MNVQELIDKLNTYPPDETVCVEAGGDGAIHHGIVKRVYDDGHGVTITTEGL